MKPLQSFAAVVLACSLIAACAASQNQGNLVRAGEVSQLIESATVLPDHTYYFTGPQAQPDAIIAIANRYTLQSKYWIKVDDVAEKLKDWNRSIDNAHRIPNEQDGPRTLSPFYLGARIVNPEGEQVGIWYSRHDQTVVQFPDPSTIIIYTPVVKAERERPSIRR